VSFLVLGIGLGVRERLRNNIMRTLDSIYTWINRVISTAANQQGTYQD